MEATTNNSRVKLACMNTLAERISERMRELGLKPVRIASALGISRASVTQWLNGETKAIKTEHAIELARLLKCNLRWLTTGHGSKELTKSSVDDHVLEKCLEKAIEATKETGRDLTPQQLAKLVAFLYVQHSKETNLPVVTAIDVIEMFLIQNPSLKEK